MVSRDLLEELASLAVQYQATSLIAQVYDQYLDYITLEPQLFNLDITNTYHILHNPTTPESVIEQMVETISSRLFSVIVTYGTVPIIKCPKGTVAEAVARKLDARLRENIMNSRASLFENMNVTRPVLILLDRNLDLAAMLTHSWQYASLFQDMFEMRLNRVQPTIEEKGRQVQKNYDVDVMDSFWIKNAARALPQVGIFIEEETKKYKEVVSRVGEGDDITQQLSETMDQLPELRMRQKVLDMHTVLATHLLNSIVKRQLDSFITMEESVHKLNTATILQVIRDTTKDAQDKLRLVLVYFLSTNSVGKGEVEEVEKALKEVGCDTSPLQYVKHMQMYSQKPQTQQPTPTGDLLGSFSSNFSKLAESIQTTGIGEGFGSLISGVKNIISRKELRVTKVVESIMEGSNDEYTTFDPKVVKQVPMKQTFQDAVVCVIGGGNYIEYHDLLEYAQRTGRNVSYGTTEVLSANKFIQQMSGLGLD